MVKQLTTAQLLEHMYGIKNELKTEIHAVKYGVKMQMDGMQHQMDGMQSKMDGMQHQIGGIQTQLGRMEGILIELRDGRKEDQKRFERIEKHVGLAV